MVDMEPKIKTLVWLGTAIAPLSIVGSCLTLTTIYRTATSTRRIRRRASSMSTLGSNNSPTPTPTPSSRAVQRQQQQAQQNSKITTYHHLMVCISIFDIILSTAIFFGPLPIPVETGFPYARGTQGTCTCQGFMMQLGTASFGLNGMLMIYFVLVICFNMTDSTIGSWKVEPFLLLVPILFHFITAVLGLFLEIYNNTFSYCFINTYPSLCYLDPEVDCIRGEQYHYVFGMYCSVYPMFIWNGIIIISLLIVALTVTHRYCKSRRFVFRGTANSANSGGGSGGRGIGRSGSGRSINAGAANNRALQRHTMQVIVQCLLYSFAFLNVTIWSTLATIMEMSGYIRDSLGKDYWMLLFTLFFFPIQGFFNFLIFIRPRYLFLRRENKDSGRWFALCESVWNPTGIVDNTRPSRRRNNNNRNASSDPYLEHIGSQPFVLVDATVDADEDGTSTRRGGEGSMTGDSPARAAGAADDDGSAAMEFELSNGSSNEDDQYEDGKTASDDGPSPSTEPKSSSVRFSTSTAAMTEPASSSIRFSITEAASSSSVRFSLPSPTGDSDAD